MALSSPRRSRSRSSRATSKSMASSGPSMASPCEGSSRSGRRSLRSRSEAMLAVVVVVGDWPSLPVCAHLAEQILLDERDPDADPGFNRSLQALNLVAVVVRDVDVGDAVDADRAQLIEHVTGAEVDRDRLVAAAQQVDVAGVLEHQDVLGNWTNEGLRLG